MFLKDCLLVSFFCFNWLLVTECKCFKKFNPFKTLRFFRKLRLIEPYYLHGYRLLSLNIVMNFCHLVSLKLIYPFCLYAAMVAYFSVLYTFSIKEKALFFKAKPSTPIAATNANPTLGLAYLVPNQ